MNKGNLKKEESRLQRYRSYSNTSFRQKTRREIVSCVACGRSLTTIFCTEN
jgi:hypothetical protein